MKPRISTDDVLAKEAIHFIKSISDSDKVLLVHDADPDGMCSAILLKECITRYSKANVSTVIGTRNELGTDILKLLESKKYSHLVTLDMQVDQGPEQLQEASRFAKVLVLDHHPVVNETIPPAIVLKPSIIYPDIHARYCTSILVYDLVKGLTDLTDLDWVMCIGLIADFGNYEYPEIVERIYAKYKWTIPENIFETHCGLAAASINNARLAATDPNDIFQILSETKSIDNLWNHEVFQKGREITKDVLALAEGAKENGQWYGDVLWYVVKSEYDIRSPITTMVGISYWDKTIICVTLRDDHLAFSGRRNDGHVPLDKILAKHAQELGGNGGGHAVSCGGKVPLSKADKWKELVLDELKSYK